MLQTSELNFKLQTSLISSSKTPEKTKTLHHFLLFKLGEFWEPTDLFYLFKPKTSKYLIGKLIAKSNSKELQEILHSSLELRLISSYCPDILVFSFKIILLPILEEMV